MTGISIETCRAWLESSKYSDLTIDCQGVLFRVHRLIVCSKSTVFEGLCDARAHSQHTTTPSNADTHRSNIIISDQDPGIMARILLYMYTGEYDDDNLPDFYVTLFLDHEERDEEDRKKHFGTEIDEVGLRQRLRTNALVYSAAGLFEIKELQELASTCFTKEATSGVEMDGFEEIAELVYTTTAMDDRNLRFKLTQLCVENHDLLEIRHKLIAVLQYYEPNVWHVSVELMERWRGTVAK